MGPISFLSLQGGDICRAPLWNWNLGPILPRFRDIAAFLLRTATPFLFHPNFGGVSLDRIADVVVDPRS